MSGCAARVGAMREFVSSKNLRNLVTSTDANGPVAKPQVTPHVSRDREFAFGKIVVMASTIRHTAPSVDPFDRGATTTINRRNVERGTELTVAGMGRVRFLGVTTNPRNGATWLDVVDRHGALRSARPERVTRVHRKTRGRAS